MSWFIYSTSLSWRCGPFHSPQHLAAARTFSDVNVAFRVAPCAADYGGGCPGAPPPPKPCQQCTLRLPRSAQMRPVPSLPPAPFSVCHPLILCPSCPAPFPPSLPGLGVHSTNSNPVARARVSAASPPDRCPPSSLRSTTLEGLYQRLSCPSAPYLLLRPASLLSCVSVYCLPSKPGPPFFHPGLRRGAIA